MTSLHTPGSFIVSYETPSGKIISFEENDVFAADTNFFKVFNFPLIKSDPDRAFRLSNTMVMIRSAAEKYFGGADAVGKILRLSGLNGEELQTYEVTGVVNDPPDNSTIQFDVLLSMEGFPVRRLYWSWVWLMLPKLAKPGTRLIIQSVKPLTGMRRITSYSGRIFMFLNQTGSPWSWSAI